MKQKVIAILLIALACVCVWLAIHATKNAMYAWASAAICAVVAALQWRNGCRKSVPTKIAARVVTEEPPKFQPTPQPEKPQYTFVRFKVAGTTFDSDGISRQTMLRKIKFLDPPFDNGDALNVHLAPVSFNGEPAIECRVNDFLIGYVPKEQIEEVRATFDKPDIQVSAFDVTGGGTVAGEKLNYGAEIVLRYKAE